MKSFCKLSIGTALLSFVFAAMPAIAQITISGNLPASSGGTYTLPITVSAHATGNVGGWQVYFGNTSYYSSSTGLGGYLDVNLDNVPTGTYQVTVTAYESGNGNIYASYVAQNVKVVSNPLPTPPSGWSSPTYPNLQNTSGNPGTWTICDGGCSGSNTTGTDGFRFGQASPSLSGAAMEFWSESTGTGEWNSLGYRHLGCPTGGCTSVSNFLEDMWFYVPSSSTALQALEYDPGVYDGSYKSFASMQCDSASGDWRFWNSAGNTWTVKTASGGTLPIYKCNILSQKNSWHHYQLYVTMNFTSHTITYETFVIDGVTVYSNLGNTYNALAETGTPTINIEQQIDNHTANITDSEYLDNYNFWVW